MITFKDLYSALIQITEGVENISWSRFYNFLMSNSILILAWATIYVSTANPPLKKTILCSIALLGGLSGIVFGDLGRRTRLYMDEHAKQLKSIEDIQSIWEPGITNDMKPNSIVQDVIKSGHIWSSNPFILRYVPLSYSVLCLFMLIASLIY